MIAVIAVAFYNYFQSRANRATVEVKLVVDEFLEQLTSRPEGSAPIPRTPSLTSATGESKDGSLPGQVATSES